MEGMIALTVVCVVFAIGDFISDKTNAIFSVLLSVTIIFLILFWTGVLDTGVFTTAGITPISGMMLGLFIVNMGSLMNLKEFVSQWKTVALGLAIVIFGGLLMLGLTWLAIGKDLAIAMVGPITGGFVSAIVVNEVTGPLGLVQAGLLATIIVSVQGLLGYPLASMFLKKEAIRLKKGYNDGTIKWQRVDKDVKLSSEARKPWQLPDMPKSFQTPFMYLAKCSLVALLSFYLASLTKGVINQYVMCLIIGVLAREVNFIDYEIMKKANTYGIGLLIIMTMILVNLTKVTPQDIVDLIIPVIVSFVIGVLSLFIVAIIVGKIFKYSWQMCCGIACSCLFGFPGTYVVSTEVAKKMSSNEEEQQMILDNILPKMLVAGFICLTMTSVIITGFLVRLY